MSTTYRRRCNCAECKRMAKEISKCIVRGPNCLGKFTPRHWSWFTCEVCYRANKSQSDQQSYSVTLDRARRHD